MSALVTFHRALTGGSLIGKGRHIDVKKQLSEVQEQHPAWTLDNAFVHWFLRAFLVADDELAARAVTGVSHDKGVDAILLDDDTSQVFILQGKCHLGDKAPSEKRSEVLSFTRIASIVQGPDPEYKIYRNGIDPIVGDKLDKARTRLLRRKYTLRLHYVTTATCSSPLKDEAEAAVAQANGRTELGILDRKEILALLVDYLGGAAPPVPFLDLRVDARGIIGSDGMIQRFDSESGIESFATLTFYRINKGKGATAIDVSNFFYRANLHKDFESFWKGSRNTRRSVVSRALQRFEDDLRTLLQRE